MTVVWVNKAWAEPAALSDVSGTDLDIDVRLLPFPSSGRALKLLFLLLVLPFVPITWRTIQCEKDKFHNLSCQAARWSLPFRRPGRGAAELHPSAPGRPSTETPRVLAGFERSPPTQQPANAPQELTPPRLSLPAHQRGSAVLCRGGKPLSSLLGKSSIINVRSPRRVLAPLKDS